MRKNCCKFGKIFVRFALALDIAVNTVLVHLFDEPVERVGYEDGCKVYFQNGDFVLCRFSGTEPLLRIFAESHDAQTAEKYVAAFRAFLHI